MCSRCGKKPREVARYGVFSSINDYIYPVKIASPLRAVIWLAKSRRVNHLQRRARKHGITLLNLRYIWCSSPIFGLFFTVCTPESGVTCG